MASYMTSDAHYYLSAVLSQIRLILTRSPIIWNRLSLCYCPGNTALIRVCFSAARLLSVGGPGNLVLCSSVVPPGHIFFLLTVVAIVSLDDPILYFFLRPVKSGVLTKF